MKRRNIGTGVLLLALVGLTAYRWEGLLAAGTSLSCYLLLTVREGFSPSVFWLPSALEHWVAFLGWVCAGFLLFKSLCSPAIAMKRTGTTPVHEARSTQQLSSLILAVLLFVAVCTPLLTPINPTLQGDLVTTRLLQPMSIGMIRIMPQTTDANAGTTKGVLEERYREANRVLFRQNIQVSGCPETPESATPSEGRPFVFLCGTDDAGRDVCSRVLAGTRVSLGIGIAAALGAVIIGGCFGFAAGTGGAWVDPLLMRMTDLFLSLPGIIVVVALLAFIGQSVWSLIIVLALTGWMSTARIVRSEVQVIRQKEYVAAARLFRVPTLRILMRHILPNVRPLLVTAAVLQFGNAVLGEAALSFLGLGIQPPTPSWGNMIGEAVAYASRGWWVGVFPGLLLSTVLLLTHSLGER